MNYEQAMEYIHAVQWAGHKPGLTRTRTLLAALGDPHKQLRFVHVAGTNGKGSTAAMMASCLQAAGYRVGLYAPWRGGNLNDGANCGLPCANGNNSPANSSWNGVPRNADDK